MKTELLKLEPAVRCQLCGTIMRYSVWTTDGVSVYCSECAEPFDATIEHLNVGGKRVYLLKLLGSGS